MPRYENVEIVYCVRNVPGAVVPASIERTSLAEPSDATIANAGGTWKTAKLRIEYPHPDAGPEMARATLVLSRCQIAVPAQPTLGQRIAGRLNPFSPNELGPRPTCICATSSGPDDEIWVLDIPRTELDELLTDLGQSGFFEGQARPSGGAVLDVSIDNGRTQKPWTTEPRLDEFVTRVFHEGMLEGFISTAMSDTATVVGPQLEPQVLLDLPTTD